MLTKLIQAYCVNVIANIEVRLFANTIHLKIRFIVFRVSGVSLRLQRKTVIFYSIEVIFKTD